MDFPSQQYAMYSDASPTQEQPRRSMPFAMPVSSYFRRSSRIVKPNRNQSPKRLVRRRTTAATHGHPRHPSMDQMSRRPQASGSDIGQERPLSWHPTSYEQHVDMSQYPPVNYLPPFDFFTSPFTTTEINGLITPMSAPVPNEPHIQELMTPLENYSPEMYSSVPFTNDYSSKMSSYYVPEQGYPSYDQNYVDQQSTYQYQYALPQNYQLQQTSYSQLNVDTAPPSPTLLPIQNFDNEGSTSPFVLGSPRVEKDELVGMGLYDRPQDIQSSTLFGSGPTSMAALTAGMGKGLKLEESFEPPPAEDEEEDSEEVGEEQDEPEDLAASAAMLMTGVEVPRAYVEDPSTFAGQTFFLDDKDSQHTMPLGAEVDYPYYHTSGWVPESSQVYGWI